MRIQLFAVSSLALTGIISVQNIFADTLGQWRDSEPAQPVAVSQNLQWKPLPQKMPQQANPYMIQQVQLLQPAAPAKPPIAKQPLSPSDLDKIYPEKRPQERTVPSGATNEPGRPAFSEPASPAQPETKRPKSAPQEITEPRGTAQPVTNPSPSRDRYTKTETQPAKQLPAPIPAPQGSLPRGNDLVINCPDGTGFKSIRDITVDIRPTIGELPKECPLNTTDYTGRHFSQTCFQWKASAVCTKAAYFEDVQLERYGHSVCPVLQPVISGAKFFATVPLLPYKMGVTPPKECVYTLGYYRVGNCAPYMLDPFPISVRGALFEGLAIGGGIVAIP
jgi:hypothetical protein